MSLTLFLAACSNKPITSHSTGIWDHYIIYNCSQFIIWLSKHFGGYGMGIIIFTIIIRIILLPLMFYQTKTMMKTQELAPQLKAIQKKYSSRDRESMQKMQMETQKLYKEAGVNPWASMLPLLVQLPVMWALYQAIWRTSALRNGTFLWLQLGHPDPYYIMPILAALFTFISSWLSMASMPEKNSMTTTMTWFMPIMVFFMALGFSSAITLYWVVTNAFQVVQTLIIQNPFKIRREREEKQRAEKAKQYLAHPVLGARLKEISEALLTLNTDNPYSVMGSIDALKLCSSMTLFAEIEGYDSVFGKVIFKFYSGKRDIKTIEILYSNHN